MVLMLGVAASALISYLFYRSIVVFFILLVPAVLTVFWLYRNNRIKKRRDRLAGEFEEMLQSLSVAISTGYSVENAFQEALRELELMFQPDEPIMKELVWICNSIRLNITVEDIVNNLAKRSGIEDIYSFAEILTIAKRSGGDLISIVRQTADVMHDKKEISEDIKTMITAKRFENRIMSLMPVGMISYLQICSPDYLTALYGNIAGAGIMTVCLVLYIFSFFLGSKIMHIDINVRCKRPILQKSKGKRKINVHGKIFTLINDCFGKERIKRVSIKVRAVYIDISDYDVCTQFWIKLIKLSLLAFISGALLLVYGLSEDVNNVFYFLLLSVVLTVGIPVGRIKQLDKLMKSRNRQMLLDYPDLISRYSLLLGAGINMRGAWERVVMDYSRKRSCSQISMHYIYEEMKHSLYEMNNGLSERSTYEKFGRRIKLLPYMKFSTMITQNLRKGNRSLLDQLKITSFDALEERREAMKRLGEEASSKLLLPMMMQFILVLIIIMYPALVTL